ncbi:NUDIX domain-containing protein [Sporosarcina highlanderae]|uniref:NUDIX domain-containing protein n=1 Tax=Sporosarcina highlanderae TaxID=3035916 RepID=A0ABT8JVN3_9BACL|nr:NUDIX domain-containing protein [Sporosarcina highlanderae]MDN4609236.1 NUDIX domain-containing protein [Sporosarcina highlanderae]
MKMRKLTGAYLLNDNKVLMLKRSKERTLASNLWTGIGGHVEAIEHNNPVESCLREIFEETGIRRHEIEQFQLRYILMRRSKNEIRQHYIYFGRTSQENITNSDEGELYWIDLSEVLNLEMPLTVNHMLKHFLSSPTDKTIFIGTVNKSMMEWSCLSE